MTTIRNSILTKILPLFVILFILALFHCGGGFRHDSENAEEFTNPLFNVKEFVSDTSVDITNALE